MVYLKLGGFCFWFFLIFIFGYFFFKKYFDEGLKMSFWEKIFCNYFVLYFYVGIWVFFWVFFLFFSLFLKFSGYPGLLNLVLSVDYSVFMNSSSMVFVSVDGVVGSSIPGDFSVVDGVVYSSDIVVFTSTDEYKKFLLEVFFRGAAFGVILQDVYHLIFGV